MTAADGTMILQCGHSSVQVNPAAGGAVIRYWLQSGDKVRNWLYPAEPGSEARHRPIVNSSFPLVPFSSRIRNGRFSFRGQTVQLPLNFQPQAHAIHGHGWQSVWQVLESSRQRLLIEYRHDADEWPWPYVTRQCFTLDENGLTIALELENIGREAMPAGIGLHPYFVRTPQARLTANADRMWRNDDEVMPLDLIDAPVGKRLSAGLVLDAVELDNLFADWDGKASIVWPEWDAGLEITAQTPLRFLVVYAPPGQSFFCVEPVSNTTDAFNLSACRDDTGTQILEPGERLSAKVKFAPSL